jgi:hypothetical protein
MGLYPPLNIDFPAFPKVLVASLCHLTPSNNAVILRCFLLLPGLGGQDRFVASLKEQTDFVQVKLTKIGG